MAFFSATTFLALCAYASGAASLPFARQTGRTGLPMKAANLPPPQHVDLLDSTSQNGPVSVRDVFDNLVGPLYRVRFSLLESSLSSFE